MATHTHSHTDMYDSLSISMIEAIRDSQRSEKIEQSKYVNKILGGNV